MAFGVMAPKDAREFLKVTENATMQQLADAFRQAASQCHPDRGGSPTAFRRCVQALKAACGEAPEVTSRRGAGAPRTAEERLELALRSLPKAERKEALEQMPTQVRFALHHHMSSGGSCTSTGIFPPTIGASCLERRVATKGHSGRVEYRVRQTLGRIEVRTEYVSCLDRALHFLAFLVQIRCSSLNSPSSLVTVLENHLQRWRKGCGSDFPVPQMAFRAVVCCCAVKLQGPYTDQLQLALDQQMLLQEAAKSGWPRLKSAFRQLGRRVDQVSLAQLRSQLWRAVQQLQRKVERPRRKVKLGPWRKGARKST